MADILSSNKRRFGVTEEVQSREEKATSQVDNKDIVRKFNVFADSESSRQHPRKIVYGDEKERERQKEAIDILQYNQGIVVDENFVDEEPANRRNSFEKFH